MKLRTANAQDKANIVQANDSLRDALRFAKLAKCPQLTKAIRRVRKSAAGALRHINRALNTPRPPATWTSEDSMKALPDCWGMESTRITKTLTHYRIVRNPGSRFRSDGSLVRHLKKIASKDALASKALKLANIIW